MMASRYATRPGKPSSSNSSKSYIGSGVAGGYTTTSRNNTNNSSSGGGTTTFFNKGGGRRMNRNSNNSNRGIPAEEDEEEDNDPSSDTSTAFPMWKTVGVVAIVFGCFATVYPKMFHPMLLYVLGYGGQQQNAAGDEIFPHPAMKHGSAGFGPPRNQPQFPGQSGNDRQQHSPFPGARGPMPGGPGGGFGAGEVRSSTKSVWHWLLPFYTVGIILFLLYTLSKILWKKPKKTGKFGRHQRRGTANFDDEDENDEDDLDEGEQDNDDEDEAPPNGMGGRNLRGLQRRLHDTERAMHEILGQLELLSTTADPEAAEQIKKMTLDTLNDLGKLGAGRVPSSSSSSQRQDDPPSELGFKKNSNTRGGGRLRFDPNEKRYLADLQKALAEFKSFTENYIEEHSRTKEAEPPPAHHDDHDKEGQQKQKNNKEKEEQQQKPSQPAATSAEEDQHQHQEEEGEEAEEENADNNGGGIDVMESEKACDIEDLKVEEGEGTLIRLEEEEGEEVEAENVEEQEEEQKQLKVDHHQEPAEDKDESRRVVVRRRKGRKHTRQEE